MNWLEKNIWNVLGVALLLLVGWLVLAATPPQSVVEAAEAAQWSGR